MPRSSLDPGAVSKIRARRVQLRSSAASSRSSPPPLRGPRGGPVWPNQPLVFSGRSPAVSPAASAQLFRPRPAAFPSTLRWTRLAEPEVDLTSRSLTTPSGSTSTARTRRCAAGRRSRSTPALLRRTSGRGSSRARSGRAERGARRRTPLGRDALAPGSISLCAGSRTRGICPSEIRRAV